MCTWISEKAAIAGHGKGASEWIRLTRANVFYDHPVRAEMDHALIIDFVDEAAGPSARLSVELSAESAEALVRAIQAALATGQAQHDLSDKLESQSGPGTYDEATERGDHRNRRIQVRQIPPGSGH